MFSFHRTLASLNLSIRLIWIQNWEYWPLRSLQITLCLKLQLFSKINHRETTLDWFCSLLLRSVHKADHLFECLPSLLLGYIPINCFLNLFKNQDILLLVHLIWLISKIHSRFTLTMKYILLSVSFSPSYLASEKFYQLTHL